MITITIINGSDEITNSREVINTNFSNLNSGKQDLLISGSNIKTINSASLLGSGDIQLVDLSSNQNISGVKTFMTAYPVGPGTAPTTSAQLVDKNYVDTFISTGSRFIDAVNVATAGSALPTGTYSNGSSGIGATFTVTATGAQSIDGIALTLGMKVLVKDQVSQLQNGYYTVTTAGAGGVSLVLTRSTAYDTTAQIVAGTFFNVLQGTINADTQWIMNTTASITVGTNAIPFAQLSSSSTGTVSSISVSSTNGFAGTSSGGANPIITISTSVTGLLKGNGTSISAATVGVDYSTPSSTETFTNKTYDTAGAGNIFKVNGTQILVVTGTGSAAVLGTTPTITTPVLVQPTIADFTAANHTHLNAANGGLLGAAAIGSGTIATARLGSGTANSTTYLRGDGTWATIASGGSVTSVSVVTTNGFGGSVATSTTTPAITITTTVTGILKGNGTAISAATAGTDFVSPTSNQTFSGTSTFNAGTFLDKGSLVYNVKAYGALGNGTTDDTTACQNAINAAAVTGGIVWFPAGTYKITTALKLYSGTTPNIVAFSNITIMGAGSSGTLGTVIEQATTGLDVIKGLNDTANSAQLQNVTIQDMNLSWGTVTLTNSGNGLYLAQQSAGGPSFQLINLKNVVATNCQGSGKYGFNIESMITSTVNTCMAVTCANGFFLNGDVGGSYDSVSTSVTFFNCYANMGANAVIGYNCVDNTYISFVGCACDIGANTTGTAYSVLGSSGVSFIACGCELDGTHTLTQMWKIGADASANGSNQIGLYQCYGFQSKSTIDIYVTGSSTGVTIDGFQDNSSVSGSTGLKVDSGSQVVEMNCNYGAVTTPRTIAGTFSNLADASGVIQGAGYKSSDGTAGLTQASTSTTGKSITLKNGLVVAFA